jgi:hypothetical protein
MKEYLIFSSDAYTIILYQRSDENTVLIEIEDNRISYNVRKMNGKILYSSTYFYESLDHIIALGILEKHSAKILEVL